MSTNKFYAGIHWSKRKAYKDECVDYARLFCRPIQKVDSYPVEIRYQFFFGKQPLDTLNTAIMAKIFEDAFRTLGILEEDDTAHVARTILESAFLPQSNSAEKRPRKRSKKNEKVEDYIIITIQPYVQN